MFAKLKNGSFNLKISTICYLALFCGLFIMANGIVAAIQANLGVYPWDVLHIGLAHQTGLTIGRVMQGMGFLLIVISYFLKIKIYTGTILNMIFVGLFVDLVLYLGYIPVPETFWVRVMLFLAGVVFFGFGAAIYMSANLGAGPRDSLMLAIAKLLPYRLGVIRTILEVSVTLLGFALGGPLGAGTVIFALSVGFFMDLGFAIIGLFKKSAFYKTLLAEAH